MTTDNLIKKIKSLEIQSFVLTVVGLTLTIVWGISEEKTWKDYSLIASGWISSFLLCFLLSRASKVSDQNHIVVGGLQGDITVLKDQIRLLKEELKRSNEVSHVLSTLVKPQSATPRAAVAAAIEVENPEW